jgi:hypothetical protein
MAKIHKLTKGGQTIYPATTTDAVVNPNSRKSLTTELTELKDVSETALAHSASWFGENATYIPINAAGNGLTKQEANTYFRGIYISKRLEGVYIYALHSNVGIIFADNSNVRYSFTNMEFPELMDRNIDRNIVVSKTFGEITITLVVNPSKRINGGVFYNGTITSLPLSDNIFSFNVYDLERNMNETLLQMNNNIQNLSLYTEGMSNKDIANAIAWTNGVYSASANKGGGSQFQLDTFHYSNKIDISYIDEVVLDGFPSFASHSSIDNRIGTWCLIDENNETIAFGQAAGNAKAVIDRLKYTQKRIFLVLNTYQSTDTYIPSVILSASSKVPSLKDQERIDGKISDIELTISGVMNKNIYGALPWIKAWWVVNESNPNGGQHTYNSVQKVWYCRTDISIYDSVQCTGLFNGISVSTNTVVYNGINIYGDGNLIASIRNASGINTIYRSDYSQYEKLELVLQCKSTSDDELVSVYENSSVIVNKVGLNSGNSDMTPKRIVIVGDSLVGNDSGLVVRQLNSILSVQGYDPLIKRTMGGENIIGNLTRAGGIGVRNMEEAIIPADAQGVRLRLGSAWMKSTGEYAANPYNNAPGDFVICGIRGKLSKLSAGYSLCFYDSSKSKVSSYNDAAKTVWTPNNAAYYRFCYSFPNAGEPHLTVNDTPVDLETLAVLNGYLNSSGTFVENSYHKCSDFIEISSGAKVYYDSLVTGGYYEFKRNSSGTETKIGVGEIGWDAALYDDREYPHIWFSGQNGGYEDEKDWADIVASATRNFNDNFIVCSTPLVRTTGRLIREGNIRFGGRYVNLRAYTQGQAVYDGQKLGIIDSQYTASDYETLFWPGSDKIHQNNLLSYIWAVKMWNTLLELGYVEGERIETGDYYLP